MRLISKGIGEDKLNGTCPRCRCKFESTRKELAELLGPTVDMYLSSNGSSVRRFVYVTCPECKKANVQMIVTETRVRR